MVIYGTILDRILEAITVEIIGKEIGKEGKEGVGSLETLG